MVSQLSSKYSSTVKNTSGDMEKMGLLWDLKIMDVKEEMGQSIIVLLDLIYFNFQSIEIVMLIASEDNVAEFLSRRSLLIIDVWYLFTSTDKHLWYLAVYLFAEGLMVTAEYEGYCCIIIML